MAAGDIVIDLLRDIELIVGRIYAGGRASGIDEANGEISACGLGAGREVHAVEITEGLDDAVVGLAVDHGNDLGPAGDAIDQHAAMIATGRHTGRKEGNTCIKSSGRDGLVAALAGARHHDMLTIPFRLGGQDVDTADEAQHHASEISLLTVVPELVAIRIHGAGVEVRIELLGLTVRQTVSIHVHGDETLTRPAGRAPERAVAHAGAVHGQDDG